MTSLRSLHRPSEKRQIPATGWPVLLLAALAQFAFMILSVAPAAAQGCYWTAWFSEEQGAAFCRSGHSVRAISCRGSYCDDKRLYCCSYTQPPGIDQVARFGWSRRFSEEGNDQQRQQINHSGFMSGLRCSGKYCDNLRINFLYSPRLRNTGVCHYTPPFSEEGTAQGSCDPAEFAAGIRCQASYCDNLELYCCGAQSN